jgi:hypothetical protein
MSSSYIVALSDTLATASKTGGDNDNQSGRRSAIVVIDITAVTSGTATFTLEGKDSVSGKYYTILASAALGAVATTVLRVDPNLTASANTIAKDIMPCEWRVKMAASSLVGCTYTVGVNLVGQ